MNLKGIYDALMFFGFGGPVAIIGGLVGFYFGYDANNAAGCMFDCPDPYRFAVFGMLPGVVIALAQGIMKKVQKSE